ncbi:MAG: hypothetical protein AAFU41_12525 [Pseudomonadota bacterium]
MKKWAAILRGLTVAAIVVLPITIALGLAMALPSMLPATAQADAARGWQLSVAVLVGLLNPAILLWVLNQMRLLFDAYTKGAVLTADNAALIQRIGQGFLALACAPLFIQPVQTVLLTLSNPPGQRSLSIGVESDMVFFALSGGLIIVIGWAMKEASSVAAENRAFV